MFDEQAQAFAAELHQMDEDGYRSDADQCGFDGVTSNNAQTHFSINMRLAQGQGMSSLDNAESMQSLRRRWNVNGSRGHVVH